MNEKQDEDVKKSFEKIMGVGLSLRRKKGDNKKEAFEKIILTLDNINTRERLLNDLNFDLSKYNELFYEAIDNMLYLLYGKEASGLIFFYLYERTNPDGSINEFEVKNKEGEVVPLNTPTDLWNAINYFNGK
jgi:hypothetical protein